MAGEVFKPEDFPPLPRSVQDGEHKVKPVSLCFGSRPMTAFDPNQKIQIPSSSTTEVTNGGQSPSPLAVKIQVHNLKDAGQTDAKYNARFIAVGSSSHSGIPSNNCTAPNPSVPTDETSPFHPIPHQKLEGMPCLAFDINAKMELLAKLSHIVICKFSHARPNFQDFKNFLSSLNFVGEYKITSYDSKHVFITFDCFEDFVKIWTLKSCVIKGHKARFFQWDDKFHPSIETAVAPIWVHLPNLPLYLYDERIVRSIASLFGRLLYIDPANMRKERVGCLSFCVSKDVRNKGPDDFVIIFEDKGVQVERIQQSVRYGAIPAYCANCSHLGHRVVECKAATTNGDRLISREPRTDLAVTRQNSNSQDDQNILFTQPKDDIDSQNERTHAHATVFAESTDSAPSNSVYTPTVAAVSLPTAGVPSKMPTALTNKEMSKSVGDSTGITPTPGNNKTAHIPDDDTSANLDGQPNTVLPISATTGSKSMPTTNKLHTTPIVAGTKGSTNSPSWSDSVEQNLPMDFSLPPFDQNCDEVLVEDVEDSSDEGERSNNSETSYGEDNDEEGQSSEEDEQPPMSKEQKIEKFEAISKKLSGTKSTRIVSNKNGLSDIGKWSFSEEEVEDKTIMEFNLDPIMVDRADGQHMRFSKLVESKAKMICKRSVSPEGHSPVKLKNLKAKIRALDREVKSIILVPTEEYEERHLLQFKRQAPGKKEEWTIPKRRGRPPKRQKTPRTSTRRNSISKAPEPRKRGRPRKQV